MESLQNLHTHAVDSAIQLQGNNRVLKKRPPPISDEEQRLNRRQRCTLSQLRSGHCHLLQDYKHRVFGEPSDICTDCGASPQDVRHLFACTTHPTDLSPEDLWRNPVRSIRAFSYLDNGNLDWLEDGPGRGKQQQQQQLVKSVGAHGGEVMHLGCFALGVRLICEYICMCAGNTHFELLEFVFNNDYVDYVDLKYN